MVVALRKTRCLVVLLASLMLLQACAMVRVGSVTTEDYLATRRGDVLTTGRLSASASSALQVVGIDDARCRLDSAGCRTAIQDTPGLGDEQRLSVLSELWLREALRLEDELRLEPASNALKQALTSAYIESARFAYAYLFFTNRTPDMRALEDRQGQVRDYYNFASQEAVVALFNQYRELLEINASASARYQITFDQWRLIGNTEGFGLGHNNVLPQELVAASALTFRGLRNTYRRDGLGAELVAIYSDQVLGGEEDVGPWRETPFPIMTAMLHFPGTQLDDIVSTRTVEIRGYDPYRTVNADVRGIRVPLAANFTAGYGLWLARSGFAQQSLLTLIGRGEVLETPRIYLMQPYDPNRKIVVMLHGLASSPEAWVNVANEVLGDETLRQNYQIWQVYYPTNLPLAFNNQAIRQALQETLAEFDPARAHRATRGVTLIGHSMGGVLARLMVSQSDETFFKALTDPFELSPRRQAALRSKAEPYLFFKPLPEIERAVFIAAPHRGTSYAENRFARFVAGLIRLPANVLGRVGEIAQLLVDPDSAAISPFERPLNSINNLSDQDPFVRLSADLPINPAVKYHSIMGNYTPQLPLEESTDGVVPYASAKLPGAQSELVVAAWHSVQEAPEAIVEIRRILHLHLVESRSRERPSLPDQ